METIASTQVESQRLDHRAWREQAIELAKLLEDSQERTALLVRLLSTTHLAGISLDLEDLRAAAAVNSILPSTAMAMRESSIQTELEAVWKRLDTNTAK